MVTFSRVDGSLPPDEVQGRTLRYTIEVTKAGRIAMLLLDPASVTFTLSDKKIPIETSSGLKPRTDLPPVTSQESVRKGRMILDLPRGRHHFDVQVSPHRKAPLRIEVAEVPGAPGRARPVNE